MSSQATTPASFQKSVYFSALNFELVAAASILARDEFLIRLKRLSSEVGTTLPKGASPAVELGAKMIIKKHGRERLDSVAKLHFKTTQAVLARLT